MQNSNSLLDTFARLVEQACENNEENNFVQNKNKRKSIVTEQNEDEYFLEKIVEFTQVQRNEQKQPSSKDTVDTSKKINLSDIKKISSIHNGDTDSSDDEFNRDYQNSKYTSYGQEIKHLLTEPASTSKYDIENKNFASKRIAPPNYVVASSRKQIPKQKTLHSFKKEDAVNILIDPFFGIRISKPLISSAVLEEKMSGRNAVCMAKVKQFIKSENDIDNWVIAGVIVKKSPVKTSQKGSQYLIWTLSDLKDDLKTVALFLFGSAYKQLWKTTIGTVLGVLNPTIMDQKDGCKDQATLSVDNAQKVMIFGQSKDYGICRSKKKDGEQCSTFVNTSHCEYCLYHIRQEYQKLSKRSELQSNFVGKGLTALRNKVLGKNEVFYAGKLYTAIPAKKNPKQISKDNKVLNSLSDRNKSIMCTTNSAKVQNKIAENVEVSKTQRLKDIKLLQKLKNQEEPCAKNNFNNALDIDKALLETENGLKSLKKIQNKEISAMKNNSSKNDNINTSIHSPKLEEFDFLQFQPSTSKTNLITKDNDSSNKKIINEHIQNVKIDTITSEDKIQKLNIYKTITSSENQIKNCIAKSKTTDENLNKATINCPEKSDASNPQSNIAECKNWLQNTKILKGTLKKESTNPQIDFSSPVRKANAIRMNRANFKALQYVEKNGPIKKIDENTPKKSGVKRFLENSCDLEKKKPKLADESFTSQRFKQIMTLQSKHMNLLEEADREKEDKYFKKLEIKEKMEEKMMTIFKIECKAVKCLTCKYINFSTADRCKTERHVIKVIDAIKRFFKCSKCGNRTVSLEIIPIMSCTNCGGYKWERTTMMKEKTAHVGETLSIRGLEEKHVGAINTGGNINILVPDD